MSNSSNRPLVVVALEEPFWRVSAPDKFRSRIFQGYGEALIFAKELALHLKGRVEVDTGIGRFDLGPSDRLIPKNLAAVRPAEKACPRHRRRGG